MTHVADSRVLLGRTDRCVFTGPEGSPLTPSYNSSARPTIHERPRVQQRCVSTLPRRSAVRLNSVQRSSFEAVGRLRNRPDAGSPASVRQKLAAPEAQTTFKPHRALPRPPQTQAAHFNGSIESARLPALESHPAIHARALPIEFYRFTRSIHPVRDALVLSWVGSLLRISAGIDFTVQGEQYLIEVRDGEVRPARVNDFETLRHEV